MGKFGAAEIGLLVVILVLVFGAKRLPQLGENLGKGFRNLKRGLSTDDDINVNPDPKQVADGSGSLIEDHPVEAKVEKS